MPKTNRHTDMHTAVSRFSGSVVCTVSRLCIRRWGFQVAILALFEMSKSHQTLLVASRRAAWPRAGPWPVSNQKAGTAAGRPAPLRGSPKRKSRLIGWQPQAAGADWTRNPPHSADLDVPAGCQPSSPPSFPDVLSHVSLTLGQRKRPLKTVCSLRFFVLGPTQRHRQSVSVAW